jgi:hypothetical protein
MLNTSISSLNAVSSCTLAYLDSAPTYVIASNVGFITFLDYPPL